MEEINKNSNSTITKCVSCEVLDSAYHESDDADEFLDNLKSRNFVSDSKKCCVKMLFKIHRDYSYSNS